MPIRTEIERPRRLRVVHVEGTVGDADLFDAFSALWTTPDYDPGLDELIDLRRVTRVDVTSGGLQRLAEKELRMHRDTPKVRVAIVAPENVLFGLSRMYQAFAGGGSAEHQVFRTIEEAREWLRA